MEEMSSAPAIPGVGCGTASEDTYIAAFDQAVSEASFLVQFADWCGADGSGVCTAP